MEVTLSEPCDVIRERDHYVMVNHILSIIFISHVSKKLWVSKLNVFDITCTMSQCNIRTKIWTSGLTGCQITRCSSYVLSRGIFACLPRVNHHVGPCCVFFYSVEDLLEKPGKSSG